MSIDIACPGVAVIYSGVPQVYPWHVPGICGRHLDTHLDTHLGTQKSRPTKRPEEVMMARGPKKTVEEKIAAKQELIGALLVRIESEKKELEMLFEEKRQKDLGAVSEMIAEAGLSPQEAAEALQNYLEKRMASAS